VKKCINWVIQCYFWHEIRKHFVSILNELCKKKGNHVENQQELSMRLCMRFCSRIFQRFIPIALRNSWLRNIRGKSQLLTNPATFSNTQCIDIFAPFSLQLFDSQQSIAKIMSFEKRQLINFEEININFVVTVYKIASSLYDFLT